MPVREVADRRGRARRGQAGLLERGRAVGRIVATLDAAGSGEGSALLLVGHAGMGKTRLHEAALDEARARSFQIVRAAGAELEQNLAFGVAGQLLRSLLHELPPGQRRAIVAELPGRVRFLADVDHEPAEEQPGDDIAVSHGLFALLSGRAEGRPVLMAIDDTHWCDAASLEFVLYTLHRLEELPIAVVLTGRPVRHEVPADPLFHISAHPRIRLEHLEPLGPDAVAQLVRRALGARAEQPLIQVCHEATAGNPFYLHELLLALVEEQHADQAQLAERARSLAPDAVTRSLRVRVGRLGRPATALARAVAILGDDVPVRQAAALAGLPVAQAGEAADALAAVEVLLAREPLRFVHPLVRHAVERDVPASERAGRHIDAARLLYAEGAGTERVAAHILLGRAEGSPWAVEQLVAAAAEASARGAATSAIRYLERALEEPPDRAARAEILASLGAAEAAVGAHTAPDRLVQAADLTADPRRRAELALARGHALYAQGRHKEAAAAYDSGLVELSGASPEPSERELHDQLQTGFVVTASMVSSLQARSVERSARLLARAAGGPLTQGQRLLLAQAAIHASYAGHPAAEVEELAGRAWDDGRLLEAETSGGMGWSLLTAALCLAGNLERSLELAGAALDDARRRGSPLAFATASYARGLPRLWQGRAAEALADLELALDARRFGWRQFARAAAAVYCLGLIETGDLERAERALTEDGPLDEPRDLEDAIRYYALAELRRAQGRPREGVETALATGAVVERSVRFLGFCPWRTSAAESALALGNRERALQLAREAADRARRIGVLHLRIRTLRVLGLCQRRDEGLETLRAAVELGDSAPPRLETIRALIELGAALRRANERAAARGPLQRAADMALGGGATVLYERARTELAASGARPRREALLAGPASLTPSERRIAELAAGGRTNREIAGALFVTPKTVEYHLRNVYRKLGISRRAELQGALAS